jgi:hypothetical protein
LFVLNIFKGALIDDVDFYWIRTLDKFSLDAKLDQIMTKKIMSNTLEIEYQDFLTDRIYRFLDLCCSRYPGNRLSKLL